MDRQADVLELLSSLDILSLFLHLFDSLVPGIVVLYFFLLLPLLLTSPFTATHIHGYIHLLTHSFSPQPTPLPSPLLPLAWALFASSSRLVSTLVAPVSPSFPVLSDLVFPCRLALVLLVYVATGAFIWLWHTLCLRFLMPSMVRLQRRRTKVLELGDRLGQSGYRHLQVIDILGTGAVVLASQYYDPKIFLPKAYRNP